MICKWALILGRHKRISFINPVTTRLFFQNVILFPNVVHSYCNIVVRNRSNTMYFSAGLWIMMTWCFSTFPMLFPSHSHVISSTSTFPMLFRLHVAFSMLFMLQFPFYTSCYIFPYYPYISHVIHVTFPIMYCICYFPSSLCYIPIVISFTLAISQILLHFPFYSCYTSTNFIHVTFPMLLCYICPAIIYGDMSRMHAALSCSGAIRYSGQRESSGIIRIVQT